MQAACIKLLEQNSVQEIEALNEVRLVIHRNKITCLEIGTVDIFEHQIDLLPLFH